MIGMLNPTMNLQVKDVKALPMIEPANQVNRIDTIVSDSIDLSKADWDTQETSWDFKRNPLV